MESEKSCLPWTDLILYLTEIKQFLYTITRLVLKKWFIQAWESQIVSPASQRQRLFKGIVSRDFLLLVFFMNQFPPSPRVYHLGRFEFFRKFAEIFAAQGWPPVSTTPVVNLELGISPRIFEKFRNGPKGILWGWGETDWWKKPEAKNLVTLSL